MSNTAQNTMSKKAVFFLGAGFSKAVIPSFPTLTELSKKILKEYKTEKHSIAIHFHKEIPKQYKQNIEHLLTFLSSNLPFKTDVQMSADDALYKDLKNKIAQHFENIENNIKADNFKLTPKNIEIFKKYLCLNTPLCISLNYDLLLEKFITTEPIQIIQDTEFTINSFYSLPIADIVGRSGIDNLTAVRTELNVPKILKLHGSINWLYAGISQTDPVYSKQIISKQEKQQDNTSDNIEYLTKDLQPMIVPPVMDKTSIYNHTILKAIWRQAYEKLKETEEIYICGFSFPETDLSVRFLFQSALKENKNLQKIYFINTGNDLENKKKHFIKAISGLEIDHSEQVETIPRSTLNFIRGLHNDEIEINFKYCCKKPLDKFIDEIIAPQVQI